MLENSFLNSSNICFSRSRKKNVFLPCGNSIIFTLKKIWGFEKNVKLLAVTVKGPISYRVHILLHVREGTSPARKPVSRSLSPNWGINTSPFLNYGQKPMKRKTHPQPAAASRPPNTGREPAASHKVWKLVAHSWPTHFLGMPKTSIRSGLKELPQHQKQHKPFPRGSLSQSPCAAVQLHTTSNWQDFSIH